MISLEDCIKRGLIRKTLPSKENASRTLEKSATLLEEAEENLKSGRINSAVIVSYLSMFNAFRSLLFRDGWREKSHICVARYVEAEYARKGKIGMELIELFDRFRSSRHAVQYSAEYLPSKEEAGNMISTAEIIIKEVRRLTE